MDSNGISPLYWTPETLAELGNDVIHELAVRCVGTRTAYHLMLGRCLLAGERNGLFAEYGCSCVSHYGAAVLGIPAWEAREALRVARALESLPLLSRAAEAGELDWCKLREIVRKATRATEYYWLSMGKSRTYAEISNLLSFTAHGGIPDLARVRSKGKDGLKSELRYSVSAESMAVVERGLQALSEVEGRHLSMEEASVHLFSHYLQSRAGGDLSLERVVAEASKDVQAGSYRMERLVMAARDVAREFGLVDESHGSLVEETDSEDAQREEDAVVVQRPARVVEHPDGDCDDKVSPDRGTGEQIMVSRPTQILQPLEDFGISDSHLDSQADSRAVWLGDSQAEILGGEADGPDEHSVGRFEVGCCGELGEHHGRRHTWVGRALGYHYDHSATACCADPGLPEANYSVPACSAGPCGDDTEQQVTAGSPDSSLSEVDDSPAACSADSCCHDNDHQATEVESEWLPFAAAEITACPSDHSLYLVSPSQATWRNKKLNYNFKARGTTKAQRRDLLRRDGYCCPTPGCPNRLWLQVHHLKMHSHGGATAGWNLLPLCLGCHTNVHDGFLIIKGCPEKGTLEFHDAHGRRLGQGAPLERAAWLDSYIERGSEETRAFLYLQGLGPSPSAPAAVAFEAGLSPLRTEMHGELFVAKLD